MYNKLSANFSLINKTPNWILIEDNTNISQSISVTNDAENVVEFLYHEGLLPSNVILFYIDTIGSVDILEHDGKGNFTSFKSGFRTLLDFWESTEEEKLAKI